MKHLIFLDRHAGELEKILSGVKTMILKEINPAQTTTHLVNPGDSLYFLRNKDDCALRVKATVIRVLFFSNCLNGDLSHTLKAMQPRLQLTEEQYNFWSGKQRAMLVEFDSAQKISLIQLSAEKIADCSDWITFEDFSLIS